MNKLDIIKKLTENNPTSADSWYLLGCEFVSLNQISDALVAFSEALKYCDDNLRISIMNSISDLSNNTNTRNFSENDEDLIEIETSSKIDLGKDIGYLKNKEVSSSKQDKSQFTIIKGGSSSQEKVVNISDKVITFDDVGGLDNLKETIRMKIIKPFIHTGLFNKFKKKIGGGILLYGPPGCGKTFMAKATAGECNANFTSVNITDILSKYLGESEQNIADIFSTARKKKPSVLFFDELDTMGYNRSRLSSEHMRPVIDQLLTEIEGIDTSTDRLLVIGATNMPWDVDSAFKRPGRFDKTIFVPPPDSNARKVIFNLKLKGRPIGNIDYEGLASKTELYSGADIENVVEVATESVITEIMNCGNERTIEMSDLYKAIQETRPSTLEWLRTIKNYVTYANQSGLYDDVSDYLKKVKQFL